MMLTHQSSARAYLALLAALLLFIFFLTARRLHSISPAILPYLRNESPGDDQPWDGPHHPQRPTVPETPGASSPGVASDPLVGSLQATQSNHDFCAEDWKFLRSKHLGLTDSIVYTRRCVRPVYGDVDRDVVANITGPLLSGTTTLNLKGDCAALTPPPCEPLTLQVPSPYPEEPGQYRHLMFGVASSYERLQDSLPTFAHWLAGTGAHLVLVVSDAHVGLIGVDLAALETAYRDRDISVTVTAPTIKQAIPRLDTPKDANLASPAPVEQLHFLLINDMLAVATEETQWLGVLDDDTFFPALHPLSETLSEYDHKRPHWLGALADSWSSVKAWGYMAFGGAGTFLSMPLARQLSPHLESCLRETTIRTGDGMLRDCIYARSRTRLTLVDGLYQHDFRGDAAGFFESGLKVLSVHHWKSWYRAPVVAMAAVTALCGDCFLQRWRIGGDTLLVNGYSISVYRDGLDSVDLDRVEGTFDGADDNYAFMYGKFRPRLGDDQKKSYRLAAVANSGSKRDRFRQVYVRRAEGGGKAADGNSFDEVVELIWE